MTQSSAAALQPGRGIVEQDALPLGDCEVSTHQIGPQLARDRQELSVESDEPIVISICGKSDGLP